MRFASAVLLSFVMSMCVSFGARSADEKPAQSGSILAEIWRDVPGNVVADLTKSAAYNETPSEFQMLKLFDIGENIGDNYGTRVRGWVVPPESGAYTFFIASDDGSELWLSDSQETTGKKMIASVAEWTNPREWNKFPSQKSSPVQLQAGKRYYIEALHKEGGGGDNLAVGWQLPSGALEQPIPGSRLVPAAAPKIDQSQGVTIKVNTALPTKPGIHAMTGVFTFRGKESPFGFNVFLQDDYFTTKDKLPLMVSMHNVVDSVGGVTGGPDILYEGMGMLMEKDIGADNRHSGEWPATKFNPRKDARFIGLTPQCPKDRSFAALPMAQVIVETINFLEKNLRVDGDRVWLTGFSYGGSCSWAVAQKFPERFAAIMPLSARVAPSPEQSPEILKNIGVWCAVGENDGDFKAACSKMADIYKAANHPNFQFTVIKGGGHHCYQSFYGNPEVWKWLLAQKRKN